MGRGAVFSYIDGFAPPHNGYRLSEEGVQAGARLVRKVHDLTAGTEFAAGSEVACHPNLSQPNFVFRNMIPVAIIDWDGTVPGSRRRNLSGFLWAFVHPALYGEGEPAAQMLRAAVDAYGWSGGGLVDPMLTHVRDFVGEVRDPEDTGWIDVSIAGLAVVALQGPIVAERTAHKLAAALQENGPGPLGEHARRMTRHPGLWVVEFTNVALVLGIVWNMTQKPGTASAVSTLVIAYAVGVAAALWFSRAPADVPLTATEPTA